MELHLLIRELNGDQKKAVVIYSSAETVPTGAARNTWLHAMLDDAKKVFPLEHKKEE